MVTKRKRTTHKASVVKKSATANASEGMKYELWKVEDYSSLPVRSSKSANDFIDKVVEKVKDLEVDRGFVTYRKSEQKVRNALNEAYPKKHFVISVLPDNDKRFMRVRRLM